MRLCLLLALCLCLGCTGALDVVRRLRPVTHLWRADGTRGYSLLAHEVQETLPDGGVVSGDKDAVDAEGNIIPQQVDYSKLVVWLVGAWQESEARIDALEAKILALNGGAA